MNPVVPYNFNRKKLLEVYNQIPKVGQYQYTVALINTSIPHGIQASSEDRVIFKIAIYEKFEKVKNILFDVK